MIHGKSCPFVKWKVLLVMLKFLCTHMYNFYGKRKVSIILQVGYFFSHRGSAHAKVLNWVIFYISIFFFYFIYIFNSNIEICIVMETIQDAETIELFTLSFIRPKNIILSIFTSRSHYFHKGSFLTLFLHLLTVNTTGQMFFSSRCIISI